MTDLRRRPWILGHVLVATTASLVLGSVVSGQQITTTQPLRVPARSWWLGQDGGDANLFRQGHKLWAAQGQAGDDFGWSVAIDGPMSMGGAPGRNKVGAETGSVHVYYSDGSSWTEVQELLPDSGSDDRFGHAISLLSSVAVVGEPGDDEGGNRSGAAHVYRRMVFQWSHVQKLKASDASSYDEFGRAVCLGTDLIVVGARRDSSAAAAAGSAYVFRRDPSSGTWIEEQKLIASDAAPYDLFGSSVWVGSDVAVIGAPTDAQAGSGRGAAYVFRYDQGSFTWIEEQKLSPGDPSNQDGFGCALAGDGEFVAVGADHRYPGDGMGAVYGFRYDPVAHDWHQEQKITAAGTAPGDYFGSALALDCGLMVIGAPGNDDSGSESGAAYLFHRYGSVWIELQRLAADDADAGDQLGFGVAIKDYQVLLGAPWAVGRSAVTGAGYIFEPVREHVPPPRVEALTGNTWYVPDDFRDIQSAIDAAMVGDLILVRPVQIYAGFTLQKGLTIRSTDGRFQIDGDSQDVVVKNVPAYGIARLGGLEFVPDCNFFCSRSSRMKIEDCLGQVVVEDVVWNEWLCGVDALPFLEIRSCDFVHLTDVDIRCGSYGLDPWYYDEAEAGVKIVASRVLVSDSTIRGWSAVEPSTPELDGLDGAPGLEAISDSIVVAARLRILGGAGGKGAYADMWGTPGDGGDGGPGALFTNSLLIAMGCCGDYLSGGDGGDGGTYYTTPCQGAGGNGGVGFQGSRAEVSGTELLGGEGGCGRPPGHDGAPYQGVVSFVDPPYPVLDMEGDLHPGSQFDVTVHGEPGGTVELLLSNTLGWEELPDVGGAPLAVLPGDYYVGIDAGMIGPGGRLVIRLSLMDTPDLRGFPLSAQAFVTGPGGTVNLTNVATRLVGE
ncbi:MAG: FG-GAP repeat protein [Planctomycetota bacterium]